MTAVYIALVTDAHTALISVQEKWRSWSFHSFCFDFQFVALSVCICSILCFVLMSLWRFERMDAKYTARRSTSDLGSKAKGRICLFRQNTSPVEIKIKT